MTKNSRFGIMMLSLGLVVGGGTSLFTSQASPAMAQGAMQGMQMSGMSMTSKSSGDAAMNAAMDRMMQSMKNAHLTGVQDHDFMVMMISHHKSAVEMAKVELQKGTHPELKALAQEVIRSQNQEIGQMQSWLHRWYKK